MLSSLLIALLSAAPAPAPAAVPVLAAATVDVLVTDRRGKPLPSAHVAIEGNSLREGHTDSRGRIVFRNVAAGAYLLKVERDTFVSFGKEFTVEHGRKPGQVVAALSPVSSVPGARSARGSSRTGDAGAPQVVSIPEMTKAADRSEAAESAIGCAGATGARLLQLVEPIADKSRYDAEEMLYVVKGKATLEMDGQRQPVKPGSFSIIPRGTAYTLESTGRRPAVLLSVVSGRPCPASTTTAAN